MNEQQTRLQDIRAKVREEFDLTATEFDSQSRAATEGKRAFVLLARSAGFDNPEIGRFLGSTSKSVSNQFADATRRCGEDMDFRSSVARLSEALGLRAEM